MKITDLSPKDVFFWFSEICRIPHGSGNTSGLSDFCVDFARTKGLRYHRDESGNVIIFKDASPDRIGTAPVIIQGHLDMVCNSSPDCSKDMTADGIEPFYDGEYIRADGTTLGADDGIAIAYALAILDSDSITHPPIEAVFTVDEEVGLVGANALDCSVLTARRGINIDSEEEGYITVSCAGGVRAVCSLPVKRRKISGAEFLRLSVSGLRGGHSGMDINKRRGNAIIILARLLDELHTAEGIDIGLSALSGGSAMNVIPGSAEAVIAVEPGKGDAVIAGTERFNMRIRDELSCAEPHISVRAELCSGSDSAVGTDDTEAVIAAVLCSPNGVVNMNPEIDGMVLDSLNMGTASLDGEKLELHFCVRSNGKYGKQNIIRRLQILFEYMCGEVELFSDYPAWEYRKDSELREEAVKTYREVYGSEPEIIAIHAGLECGILSSRLGGADFISFGPDILNAHTPQERLNAASAERVYNYLLALLANL